MEISVDTSDLLKWARYLDTVATKTGPAAAKALNFIGDSIINKTITYLEESTGLEPEDIRRLITVKAATANDPTWEMDATATAPPSLDWSRPWDKGEAIDDAFTLVKIVTMDDDLVCEKCQQAQDDGPYTLEEAMAMLPIHPHCRCVMQPFSSLRRLPVTFGKLGAAPELFTVKQL